MLKDNPQMPVDSSPSRIITCDTYLASFLLCKGCRLERIYHNERRRVSFVITGDNAKGLKNAYKQGPVEIDMRSFRENLNHVRDLMHPTERSEPCPNQEKNLD